MNLENQNIASLGYRLEQVSTAERIGPLLDACGLEALDDSPSEAKHTRYLAATTPAGGVAATVGWALYPDKKAVLHSLAVAPSSRGAGLGASLLASTMLHLREDRDVDSIFIGAGGGLSHYFGRLGFVDVEPDELSSPIAEHPSLAGLDSQMVRRYGEVRHGLDQTAFCLIHNTTSDATLPVGSVFWFRQSGAVLEAQYRGGDVSRGHLLGAMKQGALCFVWQSCTQAGELMSGSGEIVITPLDDGRRELREQLGEDPGELLLREI